MPSKSVPEAHPVPFIPPTSIDALLPMLQEGLRELNITTSQEQQQALLNYLALLERWNKAYNLTAIRDPKAMLIQHVLDSASILPYLPEGKILDVGTGPGLPGLILAILSPQQAFTLLDSNGKKIRFLNQVAYQLGISNVTMVHSRVETYQVDEGFAGILSRAYAALAGFAIQCAHLVAPSGRLLAMKGAYPEQELQQLPPDYHLAQVVALQVPQLDAQRHLLIVAKQ